MKQVQIYLLTMKLISIIFSITLSCVLLLGVHSIDLENVLSHIVIGLTVFTDLIISGHQIDFIEDYIGIFLVAVGFSILSFVHFIFGGTDCDGNAYIYPVMDWKNQQSTFLFCVAQVILASIVYVGTYCLCKFRMLIYRKIFSMSQKNGYDYPTDMII